MRLPVASAARRPRRSIAGRARVFIIVIIVIIVIIIIIIIIIRRSIGLVGRLPAAPPPMSDAMAAAGR